MAIKTMNNKFEELAKSAEIFQACEKVGNSLGLHIDQIGELDAQIRRILIGQARSSNFTQDIKNILEIDDDLAKKITDEANKYIFETIKTKIQAPEERIDNATLEQIGGFSLESENIDEGPQVVPADKDKILSGIENPTPSRETYMSKSPDSGKEEDHTEPLVDMLLNGGVSNPEQKLEKEAGNAASEPSVQKTKPEPAPKRAGPDPYREMPE